MQKYVISIADNADINITNSIITMLKSMPFFEISETRESSADASDQLGSKKRTLGGLEGKVWYSEDFDAPMEEFEEYM